MVESVTAPDDETFVIEAQVSLGRVHAGARLALSLHLFEGHPRQGPALVREERDGLGPVRVRGARGRRGGHAASAIRTTITPGLPYLDGFEAIFAKTQSLRVQAIRGDQAAIEFRGLPPKSRDDLVAALGKDITVQESDWNCVLIVTPNSRKKPFDDQARAQGADPGARPLGRLKRPFQDRRRQGRRRHRLPGPSVGGDQGGAGEARRLFAPTSRPRARKPSGC